MSLSKNKIFVLISSLAALGLASCTQTPNTVPVNYLNGNSSSVGNNNSNQQSTINETIAKANQVTNINNSLNPNIDNNVTAPSFNIPAVQENNQNSFNQKDSSPTTVSNNTAESTSANNSTNSKNNTLTATCSQVIPAYKIDLPKDKNGKPIYDNIKEGSYTATTYIVKPGDTLYLVGYLVNKSANEIARLNNLPENTKLTPGTVLLVNPTSSNCDNLTKNNVNSNISTNTTATSNNISSNNKTSNIIDNSASQVNKAVNSVVSSAKNTVSQTINNIQQSNKQALANTSNNIKQTPTTTKTVVPNANQAIVSPTETTNTIPDNLANGIYKGKNPLTWPTAGKIIGLYSSEPDKPHGITFAGSSGDPIYAATGGTVSYAGNFQGYGKIVLIKSPNNIITLYAHNSKLLVTTGDSVKQGEKIALLGNSGSSTYKLYFELRINGIPKNPLIYLPPR